MLTFEQYHEVLDGATEITYEDLDNLLEMYTQLDERSAAADARAGEHEWAMQHNAVAKSSTSSAPKKPEPPKTEQKTFVHVKKADGSLHKAYDMSNPAHRAELLKNRAQHQKDGHTIHMKKVEVPVARPARPSVN